MSRRFSAPVEELRKIMASRSHGQSANVSETAHGNILYRARYERSTERVADLVRAAGGDVVSRGQSGKTKRDAVGRTISNAQPFYIEFTVGVDEDVFIRTGTRLDKVHRVGSRVFRL